MYLQTAKLTVENTDFFYDLDLNEKKKKTRNNG